MSSREGIDECHHVTTHQRSRQEGGRPRSDQPRARGTKLHTARALSARIGPGTQQFRCPRPWGSPRMSKWPGSCSWGAWLQSHHADVANTQCSPPSPSNLISTSYKWSPSRSDYNYVGQYSTLEYSWILRWFTSSMPLGPSEPRPKLS